MKIKTNNELIDLLEAEKVTLDDNIIFIQHGIYCDAINVNESEAIKKLIDRHNDWECEVVDHIIELVADDFFSILENEYQEEKTINYEETIKELLAFYLPEDCKIIEN